MLTPILKVRQLVSGFGLIWKSVLKTNFSTYRMSDSIAENRRPVDPDQLLVLVEARPDIYNFTSKDHHNAEKINKLWEEIGKEMNAQVSDCKMKWYILRSSYTRYLREMKNSGPKKKKWYYADAMAFLQKYVRPKKKMDSNQASCIDDQQATGTEEESLEPEVDEVEIDLAEDINASVVSDTDVEAFAGEINPRKKLKKSASEIVYLKCPIQNKTPDDHPMLLFFKSVIPDVSKLDNRRQRQFKSSVLSLLDELIDDQEINQYYDPASL